MDDNLDFDQTQAVVISDLEDDDDLTDDHESSREKEPSAYLRVQPQKDLTGASYPVYEGDNIIGRQADTCHVCIPSKSLSKEHACIQITADSHLIFDKGSRNKTRRGKLVLKPEIRYELKHGDEISIADVKCVYEIIKQMSEIVPESDTDADSDVSESLHLKHDVTDQSDRLVDLTGDRLVSDWGQGSSDRGVSKTDAQQTLVLSESESEAGDDPNYNLAKNRRVVQETVVFESSDDDDDLSLDLLGMATQAYAKTDSGKTGKPAMMVAATQKYCNEAAEEIAGTQSFYVETSSDEEGTAGSGGTRSKSTRFKAGKSATKSRQATNKDSEEQSNDASEFFAVSTLAYETNDDIFDVDDDGSCEEEPVKAIADQNPAATSKTISNATAAVASDATLAIPSDATIAVSSDTVAVCSVATVPVPSDATVSKKSPSKRTNKKVSSKSASPAVKTSSLRLAETLITEDVVTASEEHAEDEDDMPTQIFDETVAVGETSSGSAAGVSRTRRGRYPVDSGCSDGATAPVDDVLPVSRKIFAGKNSEGLRFAAQKCISDEPTQVFDAFSDEPTQLFGGISDEATQAYGGISDEPTQDYGGISDDPTQAYVRISEKHSHSRSGFSDKPTQILNDSSDKPTQILNDSSDKPTQILNDATDKPTEAHGDTYNEPTQTFIIDSDEVIVTGKTRSGSNQRRRKDDPAIAGGSVGDGKTSDKSSKASAHALSETDNNLLGDISGGAVGELDASDEDMEATQAFIDEEDGENYVSKAEDPTQRYFMEAEERLDKAADLESSSKERADAPSSICLDSSDDSDLEEMSVLRSTEALPDDPTPLFDSSSRSHTSESTNAEPTLKYDMATEKDPTLPYDMAVEEQPGKAKKRQSSKRKGNIDSKHDGGKELDTLADTKKVPGITHSCTELSSTVIPLPGRSPLKSALVDRQRSPSPSPANRHVAFAVTVKEDNVEKQTSAGASENISQSPPSGKSDHGIPSPTRLGRSRNKRSLQQTTAFEQSSVEKSQNDIGDKKKLNLTSQIQENCSGDEESKEDGLEMLGLKSGKDARTRSTGASHTASTRRSKVHSGAEDVEAVSDNPPPADDVNPVDSNPLLSEDVNPIDSTPPLAEDSSKQSLTPQTGKNKRKVRNEQEENDSTSGKESESIVASAAKKGRRSVAVKAEEAVDSTEGRRSSARPKKKISYQQLATGVEKKQARSADPHGEAESGGKASLSNTASKKSTVLSDDSNTKVSRKSAALNNSNNTPSRKSALSSHDSNTTPSRKSTVLSDDSNTIRGRKSAVSSDDSNTIPGRKSAVSSDDSNTKFSKKSATTINDSNTKAKKNAAALADDSNTTASRNSDMMLNDSNTKANKKAGASLNDSNTTPRMKSAVSSDDSNTTPGKTSATSMNDSNNKANEKSTSLDVSNTTPSKRSTALDDSNTMAVGEQQNTRRQRPTKKSKENTDKKDSKKTSIRKSAHRETVEKDVNESDETASMASFVDDSTVTGDVTAVRFMDDSSGKDNEQLKTEVTSENTRRSRTNRTARESDAKEASNKMDNSAVSSSVSITSRKIDNEQLTTGVASENVRRSRTTRMARESDAKEASNKIDDSDDSSVPTTSRKRLHPKEPEPDTKSRLLGRSSAIAPKEEIPTGKQRKKAALVAEDPGKDSSSTAVDSAPTVVELSSQVKAVKIVKVRSSSAAKIDAGDEALPSTGSHLSKRDHSQENIGSHKFQQEQTVLGKTSRRATRKSLQVEENGKTHSQRQEKTQAAQHILRGKSRKAAGDHSELPTEEIQTPTSRGKRATKSLVNSGAAADCPELNISQSEVVATSLSQPSAAARKSPHAAAIRGRGRKSERATPTINENVSETEGSSQNSASKTVKHNTSSQVSATDKAKFNQNSANAHDKSSQVTGSQKTKLSQHSAIERDESSQNSTNLKRRKTADKLSQDSQTNESKEQIEEQTSTPRAKKSKQAPDLRTPTGKQHTEKAGSPALRKSTVDSKPRVMFTGYLDKQGEKIVRDLGGELVTGVQECSHLVTDRICRTVKFLSGLAKGLLIVSPRWLESCKQAGTFVDGHQFLVSDPAMEKQYKFNLATSVSKAQAGPMLSGYKVHVTKSVKPDPTQMQDILKFAGAQFVKCMPSKHEEKIVVISCPEDRPLCLPAIKAGISVVGAEFILTGILRQDLDLESFSLFQDEVKSQKKTGKKK